MINNPQKRKLEPPIENKTVKKPRNDVEIKKKPFVKNGPKKKFDNKNKPLEKPENWNDFKKEKRDLKVKRKQERSGNEYDVIVKAKVMSEKLRRKELKGGTEERKKLITDLHALLKGKGHYEKFVLAHDTARIVQWLLKYASGEIVNEIAEEIVPVTILLLQSKYGNHCIKRLLKYGSPKARAAIIDKMMGSSVKLASHSISAPILELAYSTWASPQQKQYLIQEFYGDMYKNSKDKQVKHLRDVYATDESLKKATLSSIKANLMRIMNKQLLDSSLVQSVIFQYLTECSDEERSELISQLVAHVVVISNSKDGARAAMQCIWHGSNKDRKTIMKSLKEHLVELSKHEHGHSTIIALLDATDDTVLLHKVILSELLKSARDLAVNEWGRKVLVWLVAPENQTVFHPKFINELREGRGKSTCKKDAKVRQHEIIGYSISTLLGLVTNETEFWLQSSSLAIEMLAILKGATGEELNVALTSVCKQVIKEDWTVKVEEKEMSGIENAGMHMVLKKLAQHDKIYAEKGDATFGGVLVNYLNDDVLENWLKSNRGCFLLVSVYENGTEEVQSSLKSCLKKSKEFLKGQSTQGAKILLQKL